jgi:virginiamycin A acetyltransferase
MKALLKKAVSALSVISVSPLILIDRVERGLSKSEQAFVFMGQLLGLVPGLPGSCLRAAYYSATLDGAAYEVHIGFGTIFCHRDATIGRWSSVGMHCIFGCVRIGENVMVANRVSIPSGKRQHLDEAGTLAHETRRTAIHVGSRSWVGEGAIIMADVGENCIVGAGSVVTRSITSGTTVAGNPARELRGAVEGNGFG